MTQINISIPHALKSWIDEQVSAGRYSSSSDVIRTLVREAEERSTKLAWLQAEIDKGRASGAGRDYREVFGELRAKRAAAA